MWICGDEEDDAVNGWAAEDRLVLSEAKLLLQREYEAVETGRCIIHRSVWASTGIEHQGQFRSPGKDSVTGLSSYKFSVQFRCVPPARSGAGRAIVAIGASFISPSRAPGWASISSRKYCGYRNRARQTKRCPKVAFYLFLVACGEIALPTHGFSIFVSMRRTAQPRLRALRARSGWRLCHQHVYFPVSLSNDFGIRCLMTPLRLMTMAVPVGTPNRGHAARHVPLLAERVSSHGRGLDRWDSCSCFFASSQRAPASRRHCHTGPMRPPKARGVVRICPCQRRSDNA